MSSILTSVEGGIIGVGVGTAAAAAVEPTVEPAKQDVWKANPYRVLEPEMLAELVVQALTTFDAAQAQAQRSGYDGNKFRAMVEATFKAPGTAETLELWRRQRIDKAQATHALHKAGLEQQFIAPVLELVGERLDPSIIANAIQQGFIDGGGLLAGDSGGSTNITPPVEVVALHDAEGNLVSTVEEAAAAGISAERLKVMAELSGNPPGPHELLEMWRRGIITETAVDHGIREGRTKTKWTSAFKALKRPLLNPGTLIQLLLKGWYDKTEIDKRMALHGYDTQQVQDWYDASGRPAAPQQMATAVARGVDGPDGRPMDRAQFIKGIRESDIRPEWGPMLWDVRFTYPPLFQTNRLVQSEAIDAATGADWLHKSRYAPEVVQAFRDFWGAGTAATTGPLTKSAVGQAITEIRNAYLIGQADEGQARGWLGALGVAAVDQDGLLSVWNVMREVPQKGLTAAQIVKAFKKLPAQWPRARALDELQLLGLTADDAATLLDE